jgi:hypothetical protein
MKPIKVKLAMTKSEMKPIKVKLVMTKNEMKPIKVNVVLVGHAQKTRHAQLMNEARTKLLKDIAASGRLALDRIAGQDATLTLYWKVPQDTKTFFAAAIMTVKELAEVLHTHYHYRKDTFSDRAVMRLFRDVMDYINGRIPSDAQEEQRK